MRPPSSATYQACAGLMAAVVAVQYQPLNTLMNGCCSGRAGNLVCRLSKLRNSRRFGMRQSPWPIRSSRVHGRDETPCFLPCEWKLREIGTATPCQTGQPIHDLVVAQVESRFRPRRADGKRRVLAGTFARNLASIAAMAGALAGVPIMVKAHFLPTRQSSADHRLCQCSNGLFPVPLARLRRNNKCVGVVGIYDACVLSDIRTFQQR